MEHLGAVEEVAEKLCHASPAPFSDFGVGLDSVTCSWKILWLLAQERLMAYKCLNQGTQDSQGIYVFTHRKKKSRRLYL